MNILCILERAAREAGDAVCAMQATATIAVHKELDYATNADLKSGAIIRRHMATHLPLTPILSEESGKKEQRQILDEPTKLIVDEIDNTLVYKNGGDIWGPIIGLVGGNCLTHAVMYMPGQNLMISAVKGKGAFVNGHKITIRRQTALKGSILSFIHHRVYPVEWLSEVIHPLTCRVGTVQDFGASIGGISAVLRSHCGAHIHPFGYIWDYPGTLAIEEAGGVVSQADGAPLAWNKLNMSLLVAASEELRQEILAVSHSWPWYSKITVS